MEAGSRLATALRDYLYPFTLTSSSSPSFQASSDTQQSVKMHRCLQCYDILVDICRFIQPQDDRCYNVGLASMAATCNVFYEPAMDALWQKIPDVSAVIMTLPAHLWNETEPEVSPRSTHIKVVVRVVYCG